MFQAAVGCYLHGHSQLVNRRKCCHMPPSTMKHRVMGISITEILNAYQVCFDGDVMGRCQDNECEISGDTENITERREG